jgi:conjugal transfer pilin signal peptidase TrbI
MYVQPLDRPLFMTPRRQRLRQLVAVAPVLLLTILTESYLAQRFSIGLDEQKVQCLLGGHRWFLIDHRDLDFQRGELMAFRSDERMAPFFPKPTIFVKQIKGLPGDVIDRQGDQLRINAATVAQGFPLSQRLGIQADAALQQATLEPRTFWVMGTHPQSFDSRYWGVVHDHQIIGKAHELPF